MPVVSLDAISNGDPSDATPVHNNFQEIQTAVNGLDSNNWGAGKIFPPSKLTQEAAAANNVLLWNGSIWAPSSVAMASIAQGGATAGQALAWNGSAWAPASIGTLLGSVSYDPTTVVTASTTSTTGADIDATNLSLTVTVGAKILVSINCLLQPVLAVNELFLGIRESTNNVAYRKLSGLWLTTIQVRIQMDILVTGLTPGSYTYKAAFKSLSGGTTGVKYGTQASPATGDPGPFTMSIYAVP